MFRLIEKTTDSIGQPIAIFECDGCAGPDNTVTMYIPYNKVKCDCCGQGWHKSDEELGITPAAREESQWNDI